MKKNLKYIYSIVPVAMVAVLGSVFVGMGMEWYKSLRRPSVWIPDPVIPIMWSIIYLLVVILLIKLMGRNKLSKENKVWFIANGILNVLWCLVFFTFKQLLLGQVIIVINLVAAYILVYKMLEIKKMYGYSLMIYPLWISVATSLNLILWTLN